MSTRKKNGIYFFPLMVLFGGIILGCIIFIYHYEDLDISDYNMINAKIISLDIEERVNRFGVWRSRPIVEYEYIVNGVIFRSNRIAFNRVGLETIGFIVNEDIECFYKEDKPWKSVLILKPYSFIASPENAIVLIMIVLGIVTLIINVKNRSNENKYEEYYKKKANK